MCLRGGNIICNHCNRALCTKCIDLLVEILPDSQFLCLDCHECPFTHSQPYYVLFIILLFWLILNVFCRVFTTPFNLKKRMKTQVPGQISNQPYHHISGQFHLSTKSHVCNEGLFILHLLLSGLECRGTPAKVMVEYISGFLELSILSYEEVVFDINNEDQVHETNCPSYIVCG